MYWKTMWHKWELCHTVFELLCLDPVKCFQTIKSKLLKMFKKSKVIIYNMKMHLTIIKSNWIELTNKTAVLRLLCDVWPQCVWSRGCRGSNRRSAVWTWRHDDLWWTEQHHWDQKRDQTDVCGWRRSDLCFGFTQTFACLYFVLQVSVLETFNLILSFTQIIIHFILMLIIYVSITEQLKPYNLLLFIVVWFTGDSSAGDVTEASWANQSRAHRDQVIVCCPMNQQRGLINDSIHNW